MRNAAQILPENTGADIHISSLVVHALPPEAGRIGRALDAFDGVETHTVDATGKLVILVESTTLARVSDLISQIGAMTGVVDTALVYHQIEDGAALDQPLDPLPASCRGTPMKEPAS